MKKNFRIRRRREFVAISKSGFCLRSGSVVVQCMINGLDHVRVGVTASRKVGNAVVRNRCKRRLRAAADSLVKDGGMLSGVDYVLIARKTTSSVAWSKLTQDVSSCVTALNKSYDSNCIN